MPTRETAPIGAPCWVDLMTSDVERSRAFYGEVFGWEADAPNDEFGGYFNFTRDGVLIAGGMANQPEWESPDAWSIYLATDDAEKTIAAVTANGGQVYVAPMVVGDFGTMAMVGDVGGAAIGIWQPGTHKGFGVVAEDRAPSWFELHTRDYDAAVAFYREVFHWDTQEVQLPDFRYTTAVNGDTQLAGVIDATTFLPEGAPSHWTVYFGVVDADAALAKIVDLGGSIVQPAEDTPYGRLAVARDPSGAMFRLLGRNTA